MRKFNPVVLFAAFQKHLGSNLAFLKGKKLLLAVSGGLDSMVLSELLRQNGNELALAHCNFKLRGDESDADAEFVKAYAEKHSIPFFTEAFDTESYAKKQGISIQMAARELRYRWFETIRKANGYHFVLTAHHADDEIETFLINLIRGTGLEGLTGIPEHQKNIIRPLLPFTREQLTEFAEDNNIQWREDRSNAETKYLRNKIRHELLPVIGSINENYRKSFQKTIQNLRGSSAIVKQHVKKLSCAVFKRVDVDTWHIDIEKLKRTQPLKPLLFESLKDFGFTEWDDIYQLIDAQTGKQLFSNTHRLLKDRDKWILTKIKPAEGDISGIAIDTERGEVILPQGKLKIEPLERHGKPLDLKDSAEMIRVDRSKLRFPLIVRKWQNGDYFYPFGMDGKKKLSKFFKDEKLSRYDKENIYLLCSANKVVWVIGKRLDKRFKIDTNTEKIIQICFKKNTASK